MAPLRPRRCAVNYFSTKWSHSPGTNRPREGGREREGGRGGERAKTVLEINTEHVVGTAIVFYIMLPVYMQIISSRRERCNKIADTPSVILSSRSGRVYKNIYTYNYGLPTASCSKQHFLAADFHKLRSKWAFEVWKKTI